MDDARTSTDPPQAVAFQWQRSAGIVFGAGAQVLFAVTVWRLFWFLRDGRPPMAENSFVWNAFLCLQFAIAHSFLLHPRTRSRITRYVPSTFYGCLYCVATCLVLLVLFANWQGSARIVWELHGVSKVLVRGCFYGSWVALIYSLALTGLGYQTGLTPWWYWVRRRRLPRRTFVARGAYLWLRHPVYLSFLGLIWFTPRMTVDHALLTGLWTIYLFIGSWLKDLRLEFYMGDAYREYAQRVWGYPFMLVGPLARWQPKEIAVANPLLSKEQTTVHHPVNPTRRAA